MTGSKDRSSDGIEPLAAFTGVFEITPQEYEALDPADRLSLSKSAARLALTIVDLEFRTSQADWIVITGNPPHVILSGGANEVLYDAKLDELAQEHGTVPFVFARPE